jgi:sortase A
MQIKLSLKQSLLILGVAGIILTFFLLVFHSSVINSSTQSALAIRQVAVGLPFRLKIPSINVDANIEQVGFTPDRAMDVPKQPDDVAWFNLGPYPGEIGSAVIDGHSGWKNNRPAVFDNLSKLKKGDKIYVEDKTGVKTTFIVREIRDYSPNGNDLDVFNSNDGLAHLNLITCSGAWNEIAQTHSDRLIVFTDLVDN